MNRSIDRAFVLEGDAVRLPSGDPCPTSEADRWFYAVSHRVGAYVEGDLYVHDTFCVAYRDMKASLKRAEAFAAKVTEAGAVNLEHWTRWRERLTQMRQEQRELEAREAASEQLTNVWWG